MRATDLTGVHVLKHDNLFMLSDAYGDIHIDGRGLGLYDTDTRDALDLRSAPERDQAGRPAGRSRRELPRHDPADEPRLPAARQWRERPGRI